MKKNIFTFWEPTNNMPEYIKLCIKTWTKFLPEYQIIILNYENLYDFLPKNYFDKILFTEFSLPMQADAIRAAILKHYGGIWMDADTILTNSNVKNIIECDSECCMVGYHIGFIVAKKNAYIIKKWDSKIKYRLFEYKLFRKISKYINSKYYKKLHKWDFLDNGIINKYLPKLKAEQFYQIDKYKYKIFPESNYYQDNKDLTPELCYKKFYFEENLASYALNHTSGIIMLHNSWSPNEYKLLSNKDIMNTNNTISEIFRKLIVIQNDNYGEVK